MDWEGFNVSETAPVISCTKAQMNYIIALCLGRVPKRDRIRRKWFKKAIAIVVDGAIEAHLQKEKDNESKDKEATP